jgi:hypothetical protein
VTGLSWLWVVGNFWWTWGCRREGLGAVVDLGGSRRLGCRGFETAFGNLFPNGLWCCWTDCLGLKVAD